MPARRRIDDATGRQALAHWQAAPEGVESSVTATAVRWSLEELASRAPGRSVEVRVPPWGAAQAMQGVTHRRGTPPAVVEMPPAVWLALVTGTQTWSQARDGGQVTASGQRTDLSEWLPLI